MRKPNALLELGNMPPMAVELEEGVLGALMLEKRAISIVRGLLTPESFYKPAHAIIYDAICQISDEGNPIDILTVTEKLRDLKKLEDVGKAYYISYLTNRVASSANIEYHSRLILQKHMARETIRITSEAVHECYTEDIFQTIEKTVGALHGIIESNTRSGDKSTEDYLKEIRQQQERIHQGVIPGIESFLPTYNKVSGGYQKGELIIIAGRPGMGKTANMMNEVFHMLNNNLSVVIHSLEMPGASLVSILLALHLKVTVNQINKEKMPLELLESAAKWLRTKKFKIFENKKLNIIRMNSMLWKATKGLDALFVDYLQLGESGKDTPYENVSAVSMSLKQMSKELEVPVIALCQLNRSVETRGGDKKPITSDLRESGQIEQDADVIDFMYRPEHYGITEDENGNSTYKKAYRLNAKMRSGVPGHEIEMDWSGELQRLNEVGIFTPQAEQSTFEMEGNEYF